MGTLSQVSASTSYRRVTWVLNYFTRISSTLLVVNSRLTLTGTSRFARPFGTLSTQSRLLLRSHPHSQSPESAHSEVETSSQPDSHANVAAPGKAAKPGWRTVQPEPKKIRSTVVPIQANTPPAPKPRIATLPPPSARRTPVSDGKHQPSWSTWQCK